MRANLTAGYATVVRWEMARGRSEAEAHESALAAIYERGADDAKMRSTGALSAIRSLWLAAEFDCGPDASEGKAAMRKVRPRTGRGQGRCRRQGPARGARDVEAAGRDGDGGRDRRLAAASLGRG